MRIIKDTEKLISQMRLYDKVNNEVIPFILWPRQREWLNFLHTYRLIVMVKKRQIAGTTLTGCDAICRCGLLDNYEVIALSITGDDAEEHLSKIWFCWESLDEDIKRMMPIKSKTQNCVIWENGSKYWSLPPNKGAGHTPDEVIIDEAGKINIKNSKITLETVMQHIYPAIEKSDGQIIMLGTAEGYGSFQTRYDNAKRGVSKWKSFFFGCYDDPTFTKEMRAEMIADPNIGEDLVMQEYPRTDIECFLMSGDCRFNRSCMTEIQNTTIEAGVKGYFERVGHDRIKFTQNTDGWVTMFRDVNKKKKYNAFGDPCQGKEISKIHKKETDEGAFQILSAREQEQVCVIRNRHEPIVFAEDCLMAAQYYNNAFTGIETNKERSVILYFLDKGYWNLYYQTPFDDERQTRSRRDVGWFTKADNKRIMIAHGDKLIREKGCIIHDIETLGQMRTFIRLVDGSCEAQEGCRDDLVMSLLGAFQMGLCCEIEDYDERSPKIQDSKKIEDSWKNADGSIDGELCGNELLDAALSEQLSQGMNYFNR